MVTPRDPARLSRDPRTFRTCDSRPLQFRLQYQTSDAQTGTRWVSDPAEIIKHYLKGWFALDFLSIAVATFDILPVAVSAASGVACACSSSNPTRAPC